MDRQDAVIEQIKKIVRLARRAGTEGERIAAENAAKRLADKAGVSLDTVEATDCDASARVFEEYGQSVNPGVELSFITGILRDHFGIYLLQHRTGNRVAFSWIGTKVNVEIGRHVFSVLLRESSSAWREARVARNRALALLPMLGGRNVHPEIRKAIRRVSESNKKDFLAGWFYRIDEKLRANPIRNDAEQFAAERRAAEKRLRDMIGDSVIRERRAGINRKSEEACRLGYAAAERVNLSRPLSDDGRGDTIKKLTTGD